LNSKPRRRPFRVIRQGNEWAKKAAAARLFLFFPFCGGRANSFGVRSGGTKRRLIGAFPSRVPR
jgi:hypothetical protein